MTESPEAPWPFTDTFSPFCTAPVRSFPVAAATHLCDPTPSCSLPHPLAHHCTAASLILPGCCDAVGKGALDPTVRGHGSKVHSQTGSGALNILLSSSTPLFPRRTRAHRIRPRAGEIRAAAARSGKRRRRRKPRSCRRGSCIDAPRGRSGASCGVAARGGARVRDPPDPSSPAAAAVVGAAMEADAPLVFALFQLSPRQR